MYFNPRYFSFIDDKKSALHSEIKMQDIKKVRFEALAAYCRHPATLFQLREIRWLQAHDEAILVVITQDIEDGDFAAVLLARDLKERYRWVNMTGFFSTPDEALAAAPALVDKGLF
ncbi:hypothetical protein [Comamonas terrigena]|uniref:hypothetical protein n=1 Tax=Comamonas terrigena TaxID=32013 RepID=UPI00289C6C43|nr:hypothetical protein [Comamonas terrigena]